MAEKLVIIGGGPAGLSAAMYAAREDFEPLVIAGFAAGGQLLLTTVVENFPGFPDGIDGPEIIMKMREQAEKFGARFVNENATGVDFSSKPYRIMTDNKTYEAETVIIATGADSMWIGIESEKKFMGKGVSSCATCDGPFYKGKDVIVVGGGDSAMEEALFLTRFANSVKIVHRRDEFRASKIMQDRVLSNKKIKIIYDSEVTEVIGDNHITGVQITNKETGEKSELKTGGLFIAIGHYPNTDLFKGQLDIDENGYIKTHDFCKASKDGVFAAGDVQDRVYKQAVVAAGWGSMSAITARKFLEEKGLA